MSAEKTSPATSIKSLNDAVGGLFKPHSRTKKIVGFAVAAFAAHEAAETTIDTLSAKFSWKISVPSTDAAYRLLLHRLLEKLPEKKRRSLVASSSLDTASSEGMVSYLFDASNTQTVQIGGHSIKVAIVRDGGNDKPAIDIPSMAKKESLVFTARSMSGRQAVADFIASVSKSVYGAQKVPALYIANKWSDWNYRALPERDLSTIVLEDGLLDEIIKSVERFLKHRERYKGLGIPWHHGMLFHGPPGTGKSSIAKAIASHFKMDVYQMSLGDIESDADLMGLISSIAPKSILLLDDADKMSKATQEGDASNDGKGITTAGLRNAIDGVATPDGLLTIMSSNDRKSLDGPLTRPGRIDFECEIGYVDTHQLIGLWNVAFGSPSAALVSLAALVEPHHEITPAMVIGALKPFLDDREGAEGALLELLKSVLTATNQRGIVRS